MLRTIISFVLLLKAFGFPLRGRRFASLLMPQTSVLVSVHEHSKCKIEAATPQVSSRYCVRVLEHISDNSETHQLSAILLIAPTTVFVTALESDARCRYQSTL